MKKTTLTAVLGGTLFLALQALPAHAQATRTWVSGVGDDANPCSRTAPCKTFAGAISKTATGGEINCIDPGGFGAVTITKSISIICDYTEAGVLVSGTNGIIINTPATSIVTLKGLDIEGLGTGISGITLIQGGVLHVHKVQVRNFRNGGSGVNFAPNTGIAELNVADSYITDNGNSTTTGGIHVRPVSPAGANVMINRAMVDNSTMAILINGDGTTGQTNAVIRQTTANGSSTDGFRAQTSSGLVRVNIDSSAATGSTGTGVIAVGANSTVRIGNSTVFGNGTGVGSTVRTYKTNMINGNGTDGTPLAGVDTLQ